MANPATVFDVIARWRPLSDQETINATTFLEDAWVILMRRIPTIDEDAAADPVLRADVIRILTQMVLRVMRNPDGKRQESIDDYSWTRDQAVSAGLLYLSDDEFESLYPAQASGAFTIRAAATPYVVDPTYPYYGANPYGYSL